MFNKHTTKKFSRTVKNGGDAFDKTFESMNEAFKHLGDVFQSDEVKSAFADMKECRIENEKMVVDINGSAIEIKGEVTSIKINGKVISF